MFTDTQTLSVMKINRLLFLAFRTFTNGMNAKPRPIDFSFCVSCFCSAIRPPFFVSTHFGVFTIVETQVVLETRGNPAEKFLEWREDDWHN